jgi:hypothetical protein
MSPIGRRGPQFVAAQRCVSSARCQMLLTPVLTKDWIKLNVPVHHLDE